MNTLRILLVKCALLLLAGCARRESLDWPVDQPGQFRVGFDRTRFVVSYAFHDAPREVEVVRWYPTRDSSGQPARYMDAWERPDVLWGAAPYTEEELPLVLFSHGNLSFAEQSWFLAEHLASHGYVVVAPNHTGNTLVNAGETRPPSMLSARPLDVRHTLDLFFALSAEGSAAGTLIADRAVIVGHSFGGYTALATLGAGYDLGGEACTKPDGWCSDLDATTRAELERGFADPRIIGAVAMAPGDFSKIGDAGTARIAPPVLEITGGMDKSVPNASEGDRYWAALAGAEHRRVDLPRAGHHTFDVTCEIFTVLGQGDGCGEGFVAPAEGQALIQAYALAFARRAFFEDDSVDAILDGPGLPSSEAVLSTK